MTGPVVGPAAQVAPAYPYPLRPHDRLAAVDARAHEVRVATTTWIADRSRSDERSRAFTLFRRHFVLLGDVVEAMVAAVLDHLRRNADPSEPGRTYEACRHAEARLEKARGLFDWYRTKYEQRDSGPGADVLGAADRLVLSCWRAPLEEVGPTARPSAPLSFLSPGADAWATLRGHPPAVAPVTDEVIGRFVRSLPVPTIALPAATAREPWLLAIVGHEVGHHLLGDGLPALGPVESALLSAGGDRGDDWVAWAPEVGADAWGVLSTGPATAHLVAPRVAASPESLLQPIDALQSYPPPLVRLALLGELNRRLDPTATVPGADAVRALLDLDAYRRAGATGRDEHLAHLAVVGDVAEALLSVRIGARTADAHWLSAHLGTKGSAAGWAPRMLRKAPLRPPLSSPWAARAVALAAVLAAGRLDAVPDRDAAVDHLTTNTIGWMRACSAEGQLAGRADEKVDAEKLGIRLADELLAWEPL